MQPTGRKPALAVVIVNYRSWPDVEPLVATLVRSSGVLDGSAEILVVDNASVEAGPRVAPGASRRSQADPASGE